MTDIARAVRQAMVIAVLVLAACGPIAARPSEGQTPNQYAYKPQLLQGLQLIDEGKYVKARELADAFFAKEPESFQSWYLMAVVMEYCEGNLPRAWYFFEGARNRLEKLYGGEEIPTDGPWWLHLRTLLALADVAGQMEKFEEEIVLLDTYERLYKPSQKALYAWPLMKLGRHDEARRKIAEALRERPDDESSVATAYNSLGAVEGETENIQASYKTFLKLIDVVKSRGWRLEATYFYNAAEQAMELHRFDEQEQLLIEATKHFDPASWTNPYISLSALYLSSGRIGEAMSAIRRMHQWSHDSEPRIEQQHWKEQQEITASGLLAAGYDLDALALMGRMMNRPDRRGAISMSQDQAEISTLVLYHELLQTERERYDEHLSWCTWSDWFRLQAARVENKRQIWAVASRAASVIIENDRLVWSLRPYAIDSRIPEWVRPSLGHILGEGVVAVEAGRLLARDGEIGAREKPYLLATLGESDARQGRPGLSIEHLQAALATLPEAEVLLRARVRAVLALCLERQGEFEAAVAAWRGTLEKAPNMVRELGLALPVRIESDATPAARIAAGWLRHSPRFDDVGAGFTIRVGESGSGLGATLQCADGTVLCAVTVANDADARQTARQLCQELHTKAFTPKIDLSQTDINSLDGSNESSDTSRERLLKVFGLPGPSPSPSASP